MERFYGLTFFIRAVVLLSSCFVVTACQGAVNGEGDQKSDEVATAESGGGLSEIQRSIRERISPLGNEVKRSASEELEKLFAVEYKVVEYDQTVSHQEFENQLNLLGKERWDCFHVESLDDTIRVWCKRRPRSYLQHISKLGWLL